MGIPKFFKFISDLNNKYLDTPDKLFLNTAEPNPDIKKLYLDFNGIIFDVISEHPEFDNESEEAVQGVKYCLIEKIQLLKVLFPSAKIYIFLEAIPTISKLKEQYGRRLYRKIITSIEYNLIERFGIDPSSIEEFDYSLLNFNIEKSSFLKDFKELTNMTFPDVEFNIFNEENDDNKYGEAEHRIMNHIMLNYSPNEKYAILSSDADLILLSIIITNKLLIQGKNVSVDVVRRSDMNYKDNSIEKTNIVDFGESRKFYIINTLKLMNCLYLSNTIESKSFNDYIFDIIFVFNILGDDFIPAISGFNPDTDMTKLFNSLNTIDSGNILDTDSEGLKKINFDNLLKFISYPDLQNIVQQPSKANNFIYSEFYDINENYNTIVYKFILNALESGKYIKCINNYCDGDKNVFPFDYFLRKNPGYKIMSKPQNLTLQEIALGHKNFANIQLKDKNTGRVYKYITDLLIFDTRDYQKYMVKLNNPFANPYDITKAKYDGVNLILLDNKIIKNNFIPDNILSNYFEGYTFVLDLYFNLNGKTNNNWWYYKYDVKPTFIQLKNYLEKIKKNAQDLNIEPKIPAYDLDPRKNHPYLNYENYSSYLSKMVNNTIKNLKANLGLSPHENIKYENIYSFSKNKNLIFNCEEQKYFNKCELNFPNTKFIDPFDWIENNSVQIENNSVQIKNNSIPIENLNINNDNNSYYLKYIKYKNKYLQLKTKYKNLIQNTK